MFSWKILINFKVRKNKSSQMTQKEFDCDIKRSVIYFYSTQLSHTAERYPTLPVLGELTNHEEIVKYFFKRI